MAAPVIDVIDPSGRRHTVNGWAAEIIGMMLVYQNRINAARSGVVLADFGPSVGLKVKFTENLDGKG